MNGFTVFILILGAAVFAAAVVLLPWYLVYKLEEWGCKD